MSEKCRNNKIDAISEGLSMSPINGSQGYKNFHVFTWESELARFYS